MKRYIWLGFIGIVGLILFAPIVPRYGAPFVGGGCQDASGSLSMYTWFMDSQVGKNAGIGEDSDYCVDRQKIYFIQKEIEGVDLETFKLIADKDQFAEDKKGLYFHNHLVYIWSATDKRAPLRKIGSGCVTNEVSIWCRDVMLPKTVDVDSFEVLGTIAPVYFKDNNNVYYLNEILSGADPKSFVVNPTNDELAEDKNNTYKYGMLVPKSLLSTLLNIVK